MFVSQATKNIANILKKLQGAPTWGWTEKIHSKSPTALDGSTFHKNKSLKSTIWVFPKIGVPQNGWFIMEHPIKIHDLRYPYFWKHPLLGALEITTQQFTTCEKWWGRVAAPAFTPTAFGNQKKSMTGKNPPRWINPRNSRYSRYSWWWVLWLLVSPGRVPIEGHPLGCHVSSVSKITAGQKSSCIIPYILRD